MSCGTHLAKMIDFSAVKVILTITDCAVESTESTRH